VREIYNVHDPKDHCESDSQEGVSPPQNQTVQCVLEKLVQ
jgi:hypothetical protein